MSYTPTTWTTGDTITATKLNKIEQGIANAGGALICNSSYDDDANNYVLDKTAGEIYEALLAGAPAYIKYQYGTVEEYNGALYLAPIIRISNYNYDDDMKFYATRPVINGSVVGSKYSTGIPSILVYTASGLDSYPEYYFATDVDPSVMGAGSIG